MDQIKPFLTRLRREGWDTVAVIPHHYVSLQPGTFQLTAPPPSFKIPWFIYPDVGQDPAHPFHNTPEPELVHAVCRTAADLGLRVLLKPHIDSYASAWRGQISVKDRAADWVWSYRQRFLARYLDIAREVDGTILSLGCELYTVSKELGAEFWRGMADWVRQQGFHGPLTYAAAWGAVDDAEHQRLADLWPRLDYIGVEGYFPLVAPGAPRTVYAGSGGPRPTDAATSRPRIDDDLLALSRKTGKPLLFTEIGYAPPSATGPAVAPPAGRDQALPSRLVQTFHRRWDNVDEMAGYFWCDSLLAQAGGPPVGPERPPVPAEPLIVLPPSTRSPWSAFTADRTRPGTLAAALKPQLTQRLQA